MSVSNEAIILSKIRSKESILEKQISRAFEVDGLVDTFTQIVSDDTILIGTGDTYNTGVGNPTLTFNVKPGVDYLLHANVLLDFQFNFSGNHGARIYDVTNSEYIGYYGNSHNVALGGDVHVYTMNIAKVVSASQSSLEYRLDIIDNSADDIRKIKWSMSLTKLA